MYICIQRKLFTFPEVIIALMEKSPFTRVNFLRVLILRKINRVDFHAFRNCAEIKKYFIIFRLQTIRMVLKDIMIITRVRTIYTYRIVSNHKTSSSKAPATYVEVPLCIYIYIYVYTIYAVQCLKLQRYPIKQTW